MGNFTGLAKHGHHLNSLALLVLLEVVNKEARDIWYPTLEKIGWVDVPGAMEILDQASATVTEDALRSHGGRILGE